MERAGDDVAEVEGRTVVDGGQEVTGEGVLQPLLGPPAGGGGGRGLGGGEGGVRWCRGVWIGWRLVRVRGW